MTSKYLRVWRWAALVLALTLVITACSDADDGTDDTTADTTADTTGDTTGDTGGDTDTSEPAAAGGGTLTVASVESIDNWDPLAQVNPSYMDLVYDNLIGLEADGVTFVPELATEWEQTNEYIELTLREDAVFHDGTPIDAEAVAMNIERMRDTPSSAQATFANITDIEATDEYTVRLTLSEPTGGILEELAGYIGNIAAPASIEDGTFEEPIGSGAWQYNAEETVPGSEVVVDRFADYYAPDEVGPDRIVYLEVFDAEQRYNALQTGEADVIYGTGSLADRAEADGYELTIYPKVQWAVHMTDIEDVFADETVRQAVCTAIDQQQFLDAHYGGYGEVQSQLFPEGAPGHDPELEGYTYDVAAAQALLEEAGNPSIEFTLPTSDEYAAISQVFASQMAEIGITVNVDVMPFGEYIGAYNTGESPVIIFSSAADTGPYSYYTRRFSPGGALNPLGLEYTELQEIIQEGAAAETPEEANESWQAFSTAVLEGAHDCGHFLHPGIWISNPETVANVVPTDYQIDAFRYEEVEVLGG